jgi:hypothetical protein
MPNSGIAQTRLVDYFSNLAVPDFATAVENEFAAMILSLASSPLLQSETNISTPCTISTAVLVWDYNPLWLVLSYGLAVFFMLIAALIGAFAFKKNGYGADMSFSSIVATTRNKDLDGLAEGCCLGITPLPTSFVKERLRFGEVDGMVDGVGVKHTAFGFKGRVGSISVGEKYS